VIGSRIADVPGVRPQLRRGDGQLRPRAGDKRSGRRAPGSRGLGLVRVFGHFRMDPHSSAPGVQFYSGNFLDGTLRPQVQYSVVIYCTSIVSILKRRDLTKALF